MAYRIPTKEEMEDEAAAVLCSVRSATSVRRDGPGALPQTHDFDLVTASRRSIALEVTSTTVANVVNFSVTRDNLAWTTDLLQRNWSVTVEGASESSSGTRLDRLRVELFNLLGDAESLGAADGEDLIGGRTDGFDSDLAKPLSRLSQLGVKNVNSCGIKWQDLAQIAVGWTRQLTNRSVNSVVEDLVSSNLEKLTASSADERHVFVWVNDSDAELDTKMWLYDVPADFPDLPEAIDVVWLGQWSPRWKPTSNSAHLWMLQRGAKWRDVSQFLSAL